MLIVDDLLLFPITGLMSVFETIYNEANKEFADPELIQRKLMNLQLRFEMDEISLEDYTKQEAELTNRLNAISDTDESEGDE